MLICEEQRNRFAGTLSGNSGFYFNKQNSINKFTTFGIQYDIKLDKNQQIIIKELTYFPQYNGSNVKDIYDLLIET
jgi:hypothetical protein